MSDERAHKLRKLMYQLGKRKNRNFTVDSKECMQIRGHDMLILKAILHVENGEPIRMSQVAQHLKVSAPAMSQFSRRLESLGYIERIVKDDDRRSVYIQVSKKGIDEMKQAETQINQSLDEMATFLGDRDTDELIRILEKMMLFFDEKERK